MIVLGYLAATWIVGGLLINIFGAGDYKFEIGGMTSTLARAIVTFSCLLVVPALFLACLIEGDR